MVIHNDNFSSFKIITDIECLSRLNKLSEAIEVCDEL